MRTEKVETYSDEVNRVVIRHPSCSYPGVLVQGDELVGLCGTVTDLCKAISIRESGTLTNDEIMTMFRLRTSLCEYLHHYNKVLTAHGKPVPWQSLADECRSVVED